MSFIIILIAFSILIVILMIYKSVKHKGPKRIYQKYSCGEGEFLVKGKKDDFTINKNYNIEFLVKNGRIIASRDLRINKDFVYYGGGENGVHR